MNKDRIEKKTPHPCPFGLMYNDTPASREAVRALKEHNVDFLPATPDDGKLPALITPIGIFTGVESIRQYAEMHPKVLAYLCSRENPPG